MRLRAFGSNIAGVAWSESIIQLPCDMTMALWETRLRRGARSDNGTVLVRLLHVFRTR